MPEQDVELTADDLIGRTGTVRLSLEEYNGKKRNKVVAWLTVKANTQPARRSDNPF